MSTDDDGGLFNFTQEELEPDGRSGDPGPEDEAGDTRAGDEPDTRGEDEHETGGGQTGMGKGATGS